MSIHQSIIDRVLTRMREITTANGYQTDIGSNVADWKTAWDQPDLPALSVCDMIGEGEHANGQPDAEVMRRTLPMQLRVFQASDTMPADLRTMMSDIEQAIKEDVTWDGLALWTLLTRKGLIVPQNSFEVAGAAVEIEITYITPSFEA